MTVPSVPLPHIGFLLKTLRSLDFNGNKWALNNQDHVVHVYRRGSHALAAGIQAAKKAAGADRATVWIPGYFCNEALSPLRALPISLKFYPIRDDLTPDWLILEDDVVKQSGLQFLMLVHYFGFPNAVFEARAFCHRHGMYLLEDAAHVLLPLAIMGAGELQIFSPRKLLPIPSGGILTISRSLATHLIPSPGNPAVLDTLRWLSRGLAQQIMLLLKLPWHHLWSHSRAGEAARYNGTRDIALKQCDSLSVRFLAEAERQMDDVIKLRRYHYDCLLECAKGFNRGKPLFPVLPDGICPYVFPIVIEGNSRDVVTRLRAKGIPASQWPDLPPEVTAEAKKHEASIRIYDHLFLLPVHQGLTRQQVDTIGYEVRAALSLES